MNKKEYNEEKYYWTMLHKIRRIYQATKPVPCALLNNDEISFTNSGFNHFIRKGKVFRPRDDQIRRFHLFKYVSKVLRSIDAVVTIQKESNVTFWGIETIIESKSVRVVVRQYNNGSKHFF